MDPLNVGNLVVKPGEKKTGSLKIGKRAASDVLAPLVVIRGLKEGPTLSIIAGEHGCEYSGIEAYLDCHDIDATTSPSPTHYPSMYVSTKSVRFALSRDPGRLRGELLSLRFHLRGSNRRGRQSISEDRGCRRGCAGGGPVCRCSVA